jgi:hypothetical protein
VTAHLARHRRGRRPRRPLISDGLDGAEEGAQIRFRAARSFSAIACGGGIACRRASGPQVCTMYGTNWTTQTGRLDRPASGTRIVPSARPRPTARESSGCAGPGPPPCLAIVWSPSSPHAPSSLALPAFFQSSTASAPSRRSRMRLPSVLRAHLASAHCSRLAACTQDHDAPAPPAARRARVQAGHTRFRSPILYPFRA